MKEIKEFVEKAERFLTTAEHALRIGDYDTSVSRSYYAMYYLVQAVLLSQGLTVSSHKGALTLFARHFIKTGIFDRSLGRALSEAHDKRLLGDYATGFKISEEEARNLLEKARNFVRELKEYLTNWLAESS